MKTIGIVCALDSELARIRKAYDGCAAKEVGRYTFYVAESGDKQIVAAVCGIGKVNAAACTQILISAFHADCIINSGVSGALSDKLHILDIVVASDLMYHDLYPGFLAGSYFPGSDQFPADEVLSQMAVTLCEEQNIPCQRGRIVSGDQFVTNSELKIKIAADTLGITTEMEGAAIGHVCYLNHIPFTVIRCISDGADDNGAMDFDTFVVHAAERCAKITLGLIDRI